MFYKFLNTTDVVALTSNNRGGYSNNEFSSLNFGYHVFDNHEHVEQNHQVLLDELDIAKENLYYCQQIHSNNFLEVISGSPNVLADCDALYTNLSKHYIAVMSADCLPILGYCPSNQLVFAIHAGWIGSTKLITYNLLNHLVDSNKIDINNVKLFLGPSIFQKNYEVGHDVYQKVINSNIHNSHKCFIKISDNKYLFDNRLYNKLQLLQVGVKNDNIDSLDICTYDDNKFYSYRKNKVCGRHISVIGIK